jgi:hypothetical protein
MNSEGLPPHKAAHADEDIAAWVAEQAAERERVAAQERERLERLRHERAVQAAARKEMEQDDDDPVGDLEGPGRPEADLIAILRSAGLKFEVTDAQSPSESQRLIAEVTDEFRDFLIMKNEQYGDSAIDPVRVFSKASPEEQLKVRMDDKLSRLVRGDDRLEPDEDIVKDLLGYWILLQVIRRKAARAE